MTLADRLVDRAIIIPLGDHSLVSSLENEGVDSLPELISRLEESPYCPPGLLSYLKSPGLDLDHDASAPSSTSTPAPVATPTTTTCKPKRARTPTRTAKRNAERMTASADAHQDHPVASRASHASAHPARSPCTMREPQPQPQPQPQRVPTATPIPVATRAGPADADAEGLPAASCAEVRPVRLGHHSTDTILGHHSRDPILRDRRARAARLSHLTDLALKVIEKDCVTIQPDVRVVDKPHAYEMHVTFPGAAFDSAAASAARVSLDDDHMRLTIESRGVEGGVSQRVRGRVEREVIKRAAHTDDETLDALEVEDLVPILEEILMEDSHGYKRKVSYSPAVYQLPTDGSVSTSDISRQQIGHDYLLITVPKASATRVKHARRRVAPRAAAARRMGRGLGSQFYDPLCGVGYGAPSWAARAW